MMMARVQPPLQHLFTPENLGALPALWLQTDDLPSPFQEKFAELFQTLTSLAPFKRSLLNCSRLSP